MHPALEAIRAVTNGTKFEGDLRLVGGAVREELLGLPASSDYDLVTRQSSIELAERLWAERVAEIPPVTYARFGTAMVRVHGVDIEIVTARKESYDPDSRKPNVEPAGYFEDAQRRDFTVNALARDLHSGELIDPLGQGLSDLRDRVLRTPLDPIETFRDDPLRMMRAVRFRRRLDFEFAPGLREAIVAESARLEIVSNERIRDEWLKMLSGPRPVECMRDLMELGLLDQFLPEFRPMIGCEQGRFHHLDVWDHTLLVLEHVVGEEPFVLLGALFHDVAKPETRTVDEKGATRFYGHEVVGASMTRRILRRLRFPEREIERVAALVKNHMRLGTALEFSDSAARRLVRDLDDLLEPLMRLVEADASSLRPGVRVLDLDVIRERLDRALDVKPKVGFESPLSGAEIMELLQIGPGREVGRIKGALVEAVLEGSLAPDDRVAAVEMAKSIANRQ